MYATPCEEARWRSTQCSGCTYVERMAMVDAGEGQWPADETRMGEEQRAERTAAESGEPAAEDAARFGGENGMGEDDRDIVAVQEHFAHPAAGVRREGEQRFFIGVGAVQALAKQLQAETSAALQARRQRTGFAQPVAQPSFRTAQRRALAPARTIPHRIGIASGEW